MNLKDIVLKLAAQNPEFERQLAAEMRRSSSDISQVLKEEGFVTMKKGGGRGHWIPNHGGLISQALLPRITLWRYSIYPTRIRLTGNPGMAYQAPEQRGTLTYPEGIKIMPSWVPYKIGGEGMFDEDAKTVRYLAKVIRGMPTVQEITKKELNAIEAKAKVSIPSSIRNMLINKAPQLAARRWGVNTLRMNPTFYYFDGRKPKAMDSGPYMVDR